MAANGTVHIEMSPEVTKRLGDIEDRFYTALGNQRASIDGLQVKLTEVQKICQDNDVLEVLTTEELADAVLKAVRGGDA